MKTILNNRSLITLLRHDLFLSKHFVDSISAIEECYHTFQRNKSKQFKNMTYSRTIISWFEKYLQKLELVREQELKNLIHTLKVTLLKREDELRLEKLIYTVQQSSFEEFHDFLENLDQVSIDNNFIGTTGKEFNSKTQKGQTQNLRNMMKEVELYLQMMFLKAEVDVTLDGNLGLPGSKIQDIAHLKYKLINQGNNQPQIRGLDRRRLKIQKIKEIALEKDDSENKDETVVVKEKLVQKKNNLNILRTNGETKKYANEIVDKLKKHMKINVTDQLIEWLPVNVNKVRFTKFKKLCFFNFLDNLLSG